MNPLLAILRDVIAAEGPITIARYMEVALHHPEHGYYSHRDPLGAKGDFVTAPECSQMFGELIGLWCADVWQQMGKPDPFVLLELGPGRGTMLMDMMRATAKIPGFQDALRLHLIESSTALISMQREKLAAHKPVYVEDIEQLPRLPMIVLANEFFDTLPIRQFMKTDGGWRERLIACSEYGLSFAEGEVQENLLATIVAVMQSALEGGYSNVIRDPRLHADDREKGLVYEVSPPSLTLMQQLASRIARFGGAGLFIDYGYAVPSGADTLQAVRRHEFAKVLESPGEADITAYVDFSALRHIAVHCGARVAGPAQQGEFLRALGIELRAAQLKRHAPEDQAYTIEVDLRRLIDPSQMGTQFKVMAVLAPNLKDPPGFP